MNTRYRYEPAEAAKMTPGVLSVFGVGLVIDQVPTHALWAKVQAPMGGRNRQAAGAGSLETCRADARLFRAAALRGALCHWPMTGSLPHTFVENYPIPTTLFLPANVNHPGNGEAAQAWARRYRNELISDLKNGAAMPMHGLSMFTPMVQGNPNDLLWRQIFEHFDACGDMNSQLVWAEDGYAVRSELGGWDNAQRESLKSILSRDKRTTDLCDGFAGLLLARPQAAEWLRELAPHVYDSCQTTSHAGFRSRTAHGFRRLGMEARDPRSGGTYRSPFAYTKTAHVPQPWSDAQMAQYDGMPTLAFLHRPHEVIYVDEDQKDQASQEQCATRLQEGLKQLVASALQGQAPRRIFHDTAPGVEGATQRMLLMRSLDAALPGFNLADPSKGFALADRLGDAGAAAAFAGVGLASLAAWETGESALVVNLRRSRGATVLAVEPTRAAYREQFRRRPYAAL